MPTGPASGGPGRPTRPTRTSSATPSTHWKALGIGLEFVEVDRQRTRPRSASASCEGDGAWSYMGRDILDRAVNERTMNFGWDLHRRPAEAGTALHEIGHTLGLPARAPEPLRRHRLGRGGGLHHRSPAAQQLVAATRPSEHPPQDRAGHRPGLQLGPRLDHGVPVPGRPDPAAGEVPDPAAAAGRRAVGPRPVLGQGLLPGRAGAASCPSCSRSSPASWPSCAGQQRDFALRPTATRQYTLQTFGASDTVMVLFERADGRCATRPATTTAARTATPPSSSSSSRAASTSSGSVSTSARARARRLS